MSPEVASHQVYNVSADVYSWAMVCYEIFTHEKPFAGWTRDMHSNLVCGRGARPDASTLPPNVRPILEACWNQYAYRRPAMLVVEQKMKIQEEQQLLRVCGDSHVSVELPHDFDVRKTPNRNHSTYTSSTILSSESLSDYQMYP
jgi:serine/threonine protein kinase